MIPFRFPLPGVLLTEGNCTGTLAAARFFGRLGVPVVLAESNSESLTAASKYVARHYHCPAYSDSEAFVTWLLEFGARQPGYFLYGTSDDLVFILARQCERLASSFRLYQPAEQTIFTLANKQQLYATARACGIETPGTFYPTSMDDVRLLARTLQYPILVKPKIQMGLHAGVKGILCANEKATVQAFHAYQSRFTYAPWTLSYDPSLRWPMIQAYFFEAATHTYSLCGFLSRENDIYLVGAAEKVLQQPLHLGIGLAFESRPVIAEVADAVRRLALKTGYYGVFEAEFIYLPDDNRYLLMDFNPRFYGQMGFDLMRGLPLIHLSCAAALDDRETMQTLARTNAAGGDAQIIYKYRIHWMLRLLLSTQWLAGRIPARIRRYWLDWSREGNVYDPLNDAGDKGPLLRYVWQHLWYCLRHPRAAFYFHFR